MRNLLFLLRESWNAFGRNNHFTTAAALAYYGFFGMIPLLLLAMLVLGNYVISSKEAMEGIDALTRQIFPEFSKVITKEVHSLSHSAKSWGILGLIAVFWAVMPLTGGIRAAFQRTFREERRLPFLREQLFNAMAVFIILVLFVILAVSNLGYAVLQARYLNRIPDQYETLYAVFPFLLTVFFLAIFYALFAPRVAHRHLAAATVAATLLWIAMKELFGLFLTVNPVYGLAFGSLKTVFFVIAWVYVSFVVILLGAEFMAALDARHALLLKELFNTSSSLARREALLSPFVRTLPAGHLLYHEDDRGDSMLHLMDGEVEIQKDARTVRIVRPGEFFGETSMLLGGGRRTSATCRTECRIIEISRENFNEISSIDPSISSILLRQMATRLKMLEHGG